MKKQPLLWGVIYLVMLLLTFTPLVLVTICLMMVPVVVMYVKLDWKRFALHHVLILLAVYVISFLLGLDFLGTVAAILFLFFLIPSLAIGVMYRKRATARAALTAGTVAMLVQLLLLLLILTVSGIHVIDELRDYMKNSLETLPAELQNLVTADQIEVALSLMTKLLPLYLIGFSLFYAIVTHWLARKALVRSGESIPGLKAAKDWMLPRSLIWYYLIALILSFIYVNPDESMIFMILLNIMPLMMFVFTIQAFGFLFFIAHHRGWSKGVPRFIAVIGILVLLFAPFLLQMVSLFGLFDVAFPIRERLKRPKG
ncbi:DUF2232 domain-containing protein [Paenibacillus koleovorans]|uniref:DUF2232 domain-containing protein n=1 Tax=Paenibacillus koleovorans TaxID=121608 RepID=UPI001FE85840|nr:DUF2232 domain-containing protein [Paenibacillus koleovorans]